MRQGCKNGGCANFTSLGENTLAALHPLQPGIVPSYQPADSVLLVMSSLWHGPADGF